MRTSGLRLLLLAAAILALAGVTAVAAVIAPISQERTLAAEAFATDSDETISLNDGDEAEDFGLFDETVSLWAKVSHANGWGGASQRSEIGLTSLAARGSSWGDGVGLPFDFGGGHGEGTSRYEVGLTPDSADFEPVACTTDGYRDYLIPPESPHQYFLVVPNDTAAEGSYGDDGSNVERSPSALACYPQMNADPVCPGE